MPDFIDMLLRGGSPTTTQFLNPLNGLPPGRTPGFNPNAPLPSVSTPVKPQSGFNKLLSNPMLLNILAQSGSSLTPGPSPLGVIGRAGLATQQQNQQTEQNELQRRFIESQIGVNTAKAGAGANPTAGNVQSTFPGADGKTKIVTRNGNVVDTGVEYRQTNRFVENADGSIDLFGNDGQLVRSVVSPEKAARDTTLGKVTDAQAGAQAEASTSIADKKIVFDKAKEEVERLRTHPGKAGSQGVKGAAFGFGLSPSPLPATPEADFTAIRDQAAGGAFLEAYQQLKGGGPITDREGQAALAAMTRMGNPNISEKEFDRALDDYIKAVDAGFAKLEKQAKGDFSPVESTPTSPKVINFEDL